MFTFWQLFQPIPVIPICYTKNLSLQIQLILQLFCKIYHALTIARVSPFLLENAVINIDAINIAHHHIAIPYILKIARNNCNIIIPLNKDIFNGMLNLMKS